MEAEEGVRIFMAGEWVSVVLWDERGGESWVLDSASVSVSERPDGAWEYVQLQVCVKGSVEVCRSRLSWGCYLARSV